MEQNSWKPHLQKWRGDSVGVAQIFGAHKFLGAEGLLHEAAHAPGIHRPGW